MKIEKLPSGSYRIRKMYKGQAYTVIFDFKPTQKEAITAMAKELEKVKSAKTNMTFRKAAESYVDMKKNVLSPRTIKEYSEDMEGDIVHINKALVLDENKKWVVKTAKTTENTRDIIIPVQLAEKIRLQGYVYRGHPESITKCLERIEQKLCITKFPLHKLRHYFAGKMSALGVPEADILRMGGWETDHVMKSVYRHSMMDREEQDKSPLIRLYSRDMKTAAKH